MAGNGYYFDSKFDQDPCQDPVVTNYQARTVTSSDGDTVSDPGHPHDVFRGPAAYREPISSTPAPC